MARFAKLNIGVGKKFDYEKLSADSKKDIDGGVADAWETFEGLMKRYNAGEFTSADVFGTREFLHGNYGYRFAAAKMGIFGNSRDEAFYIVYLVNADKKVLDAATNRYVMRFHKGRLTTCQSLLVAHDV